MQKRLDNFIEVLLLLSLTTFSCKDEIQCPTVITTNITDTTWQYAIAGGEVISDGGSPVTARGICITLDKDSPPTIENDWNVWHTNDSSGIGIFKSIFNFVYAGAGHTISQKHYLRAYATNSIGTGYGDIISVSPKSPPPDFKSIYIVTLMQNWASINCLLGAPGEIPFTIDEIIFFYDTLPNPTIESTHTFPQRDPVSGLYMLNDLLPGTTYYLKGYIKNESGFAYSPEIRFTTFDNAVTDIDGNLYPTKIIGNQEWMAKNLKVSRYNDGTQIPIISNNWDWSVTKEGAASGYRYNYFAVIDNRKICPSGWHVPSDNEWKTMEVYLGMSPSDADAWDNRGSDEGGKLKMKSDNEYKRIVWEYPNLGATNSSDFSAEGLPWRFSSGESSTSFYATGFWTNTENNENTAIGRGLFYNSAKISRGANYKNTGLSVRCIKD